MVGFDDVFDIVVKILGSLLVLAATVFFVVLAIAVIITGAPVWQCILMTAVAVVALTLCIGLCASAQGQL